MPKSLRIADPLYGTVDLNENEARILKTKAFQRLRGVKQLGLAHLVYPGADYSRFAHSIGACHVAATVLSSIEQDFRGADADLFRIAALLHDVGHYPFSHTMEHVLEPWLQQRRNASKVKRADEGKGTTASPVPAAGEGGYEYANHEVVGGLLVAHDAELRKALRDCGINPDRLKEVFDKTATEASSLPLKRLISSDLDVDRLDYLRRTARHTGLPYSVVDVDYVMRQIRYDAETGFCVTRKAARTVDHMLVGRFLDYRQVSFHKTVKAFECLLEDLIGALFDSGELALAKEEVAMRIREDRWCTFDDGSVMEAIRSLSANSAVDEFTKAKADALLHRRSPKLVGEVEVFLDRNDKKTRERIKKVASEALQGLSESYKIPTPYWRAWDGKIKFTGAPSTVDETEHVAEGTVFVREGDRAVPISTLPYSMLSLVSDKLLFIQRIYLLVPEGRSDLHLSNLRRDLREQFELPDGLTWHSPREHSN